MTVRCARCGLDVDAGRETGGWSASGPGAWYHADEDDCGPPLPTEPLQAVRLSGGRGPWPSDYDIEQFVGRPDGAPGRTTGPLRCARCQQTMIPSQAKDVDVEQGTSASPTLVIHKRIAECRPVNSGRRLVRRYP